MNNKELIKIKNKRNLFKGKIDIEIIIAIALVVVIAILAVLLIKNKADDIPNIEIEKPSRNELYEKYVGPMNCEMQGEWVDIKDFYGLFRDDHKEFDLISALYKQEELRGIVPAGVRLEAVMLSYDDFKPFSNPLENGYLDSYLCDNSADTVELQLAAPYRDFCLSGEYRTEKSGAVYAGNMDVSITDAEYYMIDTFIPQNVTEVEGYGDVNGFGVYGFLEPHFNFTYNLMGKARIIESSGAVSGEIEITGSGSLEDGSWQYTADLVGQDNGVFINGEVYLRCKLPCKVTKVINGQTLESDSFVNVYFRIIETRIGTWIDCEQSN